MTVKIYPSSLASDLELSRSSDDLIRRARASRRLTRGLQQALEAQAHTPSMQIEFFAEGVATSMRYMWRLDRGPREAFEPSEDVRSLVADLREKRLVYGRLPWYSLHFWRGGVHSVWGSVFSYDRSTSGDDFHWVTASDCMVDYLTFPRELEETPVWFRNKLGIFAQETQTRAL